MWKKLKEKLKQIVDKGTNINHNVNILPEEDITKNDILKITYDDNMVVVEIKAECSFEEYIDNINRYEEKLEIPVKLFITDGIFCHEAKLEKQKIFLVTQGNLEYIIAESDKKIKISESGIVDNYIHETYVEIDKNKKNYEITKYIYDLHRSIISLKSYQTEKLDCEEFELSRKDALSLAQSLLENLSKISRIHQIINIEYCVSEILNLILDKDFNPVISDDILTLSWPNRYRYELTDINEKFSYTSLDIILNDTREKIGEITYNYTHSGFNYGGNVSYEITEQFQNHHYATRALRLLKELLKNNHYDGDKDLYVSTRPENLKSQKVIKNNNGKLVYEGEVPLDACLIGVNKVRVYRIEV